MRLDAFLASSPDPAFIRSEFNRFGSRSAVGRALQALVRAGRLRRISNGIYAPVSDLEDKFDLRDRGAAAIEALKKLGYEPTYGGWEWRAYQEGRTNGQLPMRSTLSVNRRMRRRSGLFARYEYQTYGYWRERERISIRERVMKRRDEIEGRVWLRSDFDVCGSKSGVNEVLRERLRCGVFVKLGRGIYTPKLAARYELKASVMQALRRLGADPEPGSAPDGIKVKRRVGVRKLGYGDIEFKLEYQPARGKRS